MIHAASAIAPTAPGLSAKGASPIGGDLFALSMLAIGTDGAVTGPAAGAVVGAGRQAIAAPGMSLPTAAGDAIDPALAWLPAVDIPVPAPLDIPLALASVVAEPVAVAAVSQPALRRTSAVFALATATVAATPPAAVRPSLPAATVRGPVVAADVHGDSPDGAGMAPATPCMREDVDLTVAPAPGLALADDAAPPTMIVPDDAADGPMPRRDPVGATIAPPRIGKRAMSDAEPSAPPATQSDDDAPEGDAPLPFVQPDPVAAILTVAPQPTTPVVAHPQEPTVVIDSPSVAVPPPRAAKQAAVPTTSPDVIASQPLVPDRLASAPAAVQSRFTHGDAPRVATATDGAVAATSTPAAAVPPEQIASTPLAAANVGASLASATVAVPHAGPQVATTATGSRPGEPIVVPIDTVAAAPASATPQPRVAKGRQGDTAPASPPEDPVAAAPVAGALPSRAAGMQVPATPVAETPRNGAPTIQQDGTSQVSRSGRKGLAAAPAQAAPLSPVPTLEQNGAPAPLVDGLQTATVTDVRRPDRAIVAEAVSGAMPQAQSVPTVADPASVTPVAPPASPPIAAPVTAGPIIAAAAPVAVANAPVLDTPAASDMAANPAVASEPRPTFMREVTGQARQTVALRPQAAAQPQPAAGTTAPAAQVFGAAMHAASASDDRKLAEPRDPAITAVAAPIPVQEVAAPADSGQPTLDMRQGGWPSHMVDHIEALRDAANATDTRIRLVPDALGTIDIAVKTIGDAIHVRFAAADATTRTMIEDAQPRLAEIAQERGLRIGQTIVEPAAASSQSNTGQQTSGQQAGGQQAGGQQSGQTPTGTGQQPASAQGQAQAGQQQPRQQPQQQAATARQPASATRTLSTDPDAAANGRIA